MMPVTPAGSDLFWLVLCWYFTLTGRCEPMVISEPVPLAQCERAQIKLRASDEAGSAPAKDGKLV